MRYVAAYLLAILGGNENPTAADIERSWEAWALMSMKKSLAKLFLN